MAGFRRQGSCCVLGKTWVKTLIQTCFSWSQQEFHSWLSDWISNYPVAKNINEENGNGLMEQIHMNKFNKIIPKFSISHFNITWNSDGVRIYIQAGKPFLHFTTSHYIAKTAMQTPFLCEFLMLFHSTLQVF